jgi:hypothetical protein
LKTRFGRITLKVLRDGRRFTVDVVADGDGLVSHAGAALLAETADRLGLTDALSRALAPMHAGVVGTIRAAWSATWPSCSPTAVTV